MNRLLQCSRCELETLLLSGTAVTDMAAKHLADALSASKLTTLDLERNNLSVDGGMCIVHSVPSSLTKLNLDMNTLDANGRAAVREELGMISPGTQLHLETQWYNPDDPHARY